VNDHQYLLKNDRKSDAEKVILVHTTFISIPHYDLMEFRRLVEATGGDVVDEVLVHRKLPLPHAFIGTGKIKEIGLCVQQYQAELVIFNHELTPSQEKNLEKLLCCRVLDRSGLILDIFAKRAQSFEGKLQVELAQLQHVITRLVKGWTHLERQRGGIGLRGPGEKQLETDRRLIRVRIDTIKKRLKKVKNRREQSRQARKKSSIMTVALVGYTSAGKSTLFNQLSKADTFVAKQLFATLDPLLRTIELQGIGKVVIADTVGFIRNLPHHLIVAFRATLEETRQANLLLHVIDSNDEMRLEKIKQVKQVLKEINADLIPVITVYNKIDQIPGSTSHLSFDAQGRPKSVWLSAAHNIGIGLLRDAIAQRLSGGLIYCGVLLRLSEQNLRSRLYDLEAVVDEKITDQGHYLLDIRLASHHYHQLFGKTCNAPLNPTGNHIQLVNKKT